MEISKEIIVGLLLVLLLAGFVFGGGNAPMASAQGGLYERVFGSSEPPPQETGRSRIDFRRLPRNGSKEAIFTQMQGWGPRAGVNGRIPTDANGNICQIGTCSQPDFAPGEP